MVSPSNGIRRTDVLLPTESCPREDFLGKPTGMILHGSPACQGIIGLKSGFYRLAAQSGELAC